MVRRILQTNRVCVYVCETNTCKQGMCVCMYSMYKKRKQKQNLRQTSAAGLSGQQAFVLIFLHSTTKAFEYNISGKFYER